MIEFKVCSHSIIFWNLIEYRWRFCQLTLPKENKDDFKITFAVAVCFSGKCPCKNIFQNTVAGQDFYLWLTELTDFLDSPNRIYASEWAFWSNTIFFPFARIFCPKKSFFATCCWCKYWQPVDMSIAKIYPWWPILQKSLIISPAVSNLYYSAMQEH